MLRPKLRFGVSKIDLTVFDEGGMAFRTPDFDPSFSARYADFLLAAGAAVNVMCFPLCHHVFLFAEPCSEFVGFI